MSDALPPFAAPHQSDFAAIARRLEPTEGFALLPVESTSPALAHALADWLAGRGWQVERCDLRAEGMSALLPFLSRERVGEGRRAYVVVAPPHLPDSADLRAALVGVNFARDGIDGALAAPLVWWGDAEFLRLSWQYAPDLWSIAELTVRVPLRTSSEAVVADPTARRWWTGAVTRPGAELEEAFAEARDPPARAQKGLRLVEALLCNHEYAAARALLASLRADVLEEVPALRPRWEALRAALAAPPRPVEELEAELEGAREAGDRRRQATLHVQLVERLSDLPRVREHWLAAFELLRELGDVEAATSLAFERVTTIDPTQREFVREAVGEMMDATEDPRVRSRGAVVLSILALVEGDLDGAAQEIESADFADPLVEVVAAEVRTNLALCRGAWAEALEHAEHFQDLARAADLPEQVIHASELGARARVALGDPVEAARTLVRPGRVSEVSAVDLSVKPDEQGGG